MPNGFMKFVFEERRHHPEWSDLAIDVIVDKCNPLWNELDHYEKLRYNEKRVRKFSDTGVDTFGRSLQKLEDDFENNEVASTIMRRKLRSYFTKCDDIEDQVFTVIHANIFAKTDSGIVIPAEICFANFSLKKGIIEIYHDFPSPGKIPVGYKYECITEAERTHKIPLDLAYSNPNHHAIISKLKEMMDNKNRNGMKRELFTINCDRNKIQQLLDYMYSAALKRTNRLESAADQTFPSSVLDLAALLQAIHTYETDITEEITASFTSIMETQMCSTYNMWTSMACSLHTDNLEHCSLALVQNWIFNICSKLCPLMGLALEPGKHVPHKVLEVKYDHESAWSSVDDDSSLAAVSSIRSERNDRRGLEVDSDTESVSSKDSQLRMEVRERLQEIGTKNKKHKMAEETMSCLDYLPDSQTSNLASETSSVASDDLHSDISSLKDEGSSYKSIIEKFKRKATGFQDTDTESVMSDAYPSQSSLYSHTSTSAMKRDSKLIEDDNVSEADSDVSTGSRLRAQLRKYHHMKTTSGNSMSSAQDSINDMMNRKSDIDQAMKMLEKLGMDESQVITLMRSRRGQKEANNEV